MKVQFVIFGLTPSPVSPLGTSGSDVRFLNFFKNIPTSQYGITLVGSSTWFDKFSTYKIPFAYVPIKFNLRFKNKFSLAFVSLFIVIYTLLTYQITPQSVIYSTSDLFWETVPAFFYRRKARLWVQVLHHIYPDWRSRPGSPIINFFGFLFQRFSLYLIRKRADIIIVLNDNVRNWLIKEGVPPERIFLSSNAIDSMGFKSKLPIQFDAVYLGRIDPTKGSNDFIPIWDFVCHQNSKAKLALIGTITPSEKQKLLSEISKSGLDKNIKIFGFLKVSEVQQILSSSKIFIFPSHEEGWGIAIAEAMSYGLPVVCWKLDNLTKVFFDHPCYAVPFDYHDFSHQVLELLDNSREAESIGAKNADFVKKFSWEKVASTEFEKIKSALVCNNKTTKILHSITHDK